MFPTQDKPFVMRRTDGEYEGMAIDIFKRVEHELLKEGINLNVRFWPERTYGSKLPSGKWTGVIGFLQKRSFPRVSHHICSWSILGGFGLE